MWESLCARASIRGKTFVSGLCLAGSLIKRQTLVMILPIFILKHFRKKLAGFTTGTIAVLVISLSLAGFQGMNALLNLWLKYASAIPTNAPEKMVY